MYFMSALRHVPAIAEGRAGMSSELNDFVALPLSDREVALVRTVLARFSAHAGRLVQTLEAQAGNPPISEENRRIYILDVGDVEWIETALSDGIADRTEQLVGLGDLRAEFTDLLLQDFSGSCKDFHIGIPLTKVSP